MIPKANGVRGSISAAAKSPGPNVRFGTSGIGPILSTNSPSLRIITFPERLNQALSPRLAQVLDSKTGPTRVATNEQPATNVRPLPHHQLGPARPSPNVRLTIPPDEAGDITIHPKGSVSLLKPGTLKSRVAVVRRRGWPSGEAIDVRIG